MSMSIPSDGPDNEHGFKGVVGWADRKQAPTSVPPERLMIGHRLPPTCSKNQFHGSTFHGSPVEARMRKDDRSCPLNGPSPCFIRTRTRVGEMPRIETRCRSTRDQIRSTAG